MTNLKKKKSCVPKPTVLKSEKKDVWARGDLENLEWFVIVNAPKYINSALTNQSCYLFLSRLRNKSTEEKTIVLSVSFNKCFKTIDTCSACKTIRVTPKGLPIIIYEIVYKAPCMLKCSNPALVA